MANSSVKTDSENIISLLLVNINQPKELEWELFLTDENKVSTIKEIEQHRLLSSRNPLKVQ